MLVWDVLICPWCGAEVPIGVMSLVGRCECGAWYGDTSDPGLRGWHKDGGDQATPPRH